MSLFSLRKILDDFGANLKDDLQAAMIAKGITSDGQNSRLGNSIRFYFSENNGVPVFKLAASDYLEFVDDGRKAGKLPPLKPIENWIKKKGFNVAISKKRQVRGKNIKNKQLKKGYKQQSREKAIKSMAFAIARGIGKRGTIKRFNYHGADFFDHVVKDGRIEKLQAQISQYLKTDITVQLLDGSND